MIVNLCRPSISNRQFINRSLLSLKATSFIFLLSSSSAVVRGAAAGAGFFSSTSIINNNKSNKIQQRMSFSNISSNTSSTSSSSTAKYSTFEVAQFPCLDDNYGYLIHDPSTGDTAAIDTPDAKAYQKELTKRGWKLSHIFNTHHHWDHTGGNLELKSQSQDSKQDSKQQVKIYGPKSEADKIPGIDVQLQANDSIPFGTTHAKIIDVGGHTLGHIAYHFGDNENHALFCGDALFALGCGRMFEGTAPQFWNTLERLRDLPKHTDVFCGHEYTASNAKFAMSVEPGNQLLVEYNEEVIEKRQRGEPTVPTTIGREVMTNPFLRGDVSAEIRRNVGATDGDGFDVVFGKIRKAKDTFRG